MLIDSEQLEILNFPVVIESLQQQEQHPQYAPYLLVENVLGIPKKVLVKVYITARKEFFEIAPSTRKHVKFGISLAVSY